MTIFDDPRELARLNLQRSFSRGGEDRLILDALGNPSTGFYVDVGAHHPYRHSKTALFAERGWTGINIDAAPGFCELFDRYRPNDLNLNVAIAPEAGTVTVPLFDDGAWDATRLEETDDRPSEVEIEAVRLDTILDMHVFPGEPIDVMNLAIGALARPVLEGLDLKARRPRYLIVPDPDFDFAAAEASPIYTLLLGRGYRLAFRTNANSVFVRDDAAEERVSAPVAPAQPDSAPAAVPEQEVPEQDMAERVADVETALDGFVWDAEAPDRLAAKSAAAHDARRRLQAVMARETVRIAPGNFGFLGKSVGVTFKPVPLQDVFAGADADLILLTGHLFFQGPDFYRQLAEARARLPEAVIGLYLRDNHREYAENLRMAEAVDFVIPGHGYRAHYLRAANFNILDAEPMASGQFSASHMRAIFDEAEGAPRSDALYGRFNHNPNAPWRTAFLDAVAAGVPGNDVVEWKPGIERDDADQSPDSRYREWLGHKVSLVAQSDFATPRRVFDALLAGQIPLIPRGLPDLDALIAPERQADLPIVFYEEMTVEAVAAAHRIALQRFDEGGTAGARARHEFARGSHQMQHRYRAILTRLVRMGREPLSEPTGPQEGAAH
ncbi:FkbM family methyltransferase [Acuticoccus sp. M5D2P5]|uniref:FkbM family methyltransferase n=1 Tax=Acuticoccus kalidii TaxID=2910977 RepID=UPI001F45A9FD|nr:FkbM family methyltransferase [Acuticoccus kalidii]MCF3936027.1 FkbM family methyltransferase [Acuticoccus kalidii]